MDINRTAMPHTYSDTMMNPPHLRGYKLCPKCGQPMLKKGQKRKHPDDYRHASGCPADDSRATTQRVKDWPRGIDGNYLP